jgi:hypothetical protein
MGQLECRGPVFKVMPAAIPPEPAAFDLVSDVEGNGEEAWNC